MCSGDHVTAFGDARGSLSGLLSSQFPAQLTQTCIFEYRHQTKILFYSDFFRPKTKNGACSVQPVQDGKTNSTEYCSQMENIRFRRSLLPISTLE
jgi:hypothetical protein